MTRDPSQQLVEALVADLEPVRRLPPLSVSFGAVLAAMVVVGAVVLSLYDLKDELWTTFLRNRTYSSVLIGLGLAALGGSVATLASVVPGRDVVLRVGAGLAVAGLLLAVGISALATPWGESVLPSPISSHLMCIVRGTCFAALPGAAVLLAATRGWSMRPELTAALALLAAGATGALLVHLTCPAVDPLHVLATHTSTPILVTLMLTAVLAPAMQRWTR